MGTFGFEILQALVTDIDPAPRVKDAMNEINAAQRLRCGGCVVMGLSDAAPLFLFVLCCVIGSHEQDQCSTAPQVGLAHLQWVMTVCFIRSQSRACCCSTACRRIACITCMTVLPTSLSTLLLPLLF
jgi:hypothetical protein